MPSHLARHVGQHLHLARHVCRQMLAHAPVTYRECLRRRAPTASRSAAVLPLPHRRRGGSHAGAMCHRRGFFDFAMFKGQKGQATDAGVDPGIDDMMQLARLQRMRARLPPADQISAALRKFFNHKAHRLQAISDYQAELALRAWEFCCASQKPQPQNGDSSLLDAISYTLQCSASNPTVHHLELAQSVLTSIHLSFAGTKQHVRAWRSYIVLLAASGRSVRARESLLACEQSELGEDHAHRTREEQQACSPDTARLIPTLANMWEDVLHGFVREENESELMDTFQMIQARRWIDTSIRPRCAESMLRFYLQRPSEAQVRSWFYRLWSVYMAQPPERKAKKAEHIATSLHHVLQWCVQHTRLDLGHEIVRQVMGDLPIKHVWDAVFVWAAGTGKGADEIGRMLDVMRRSNEDIADPDQWALPDIATINKLVEYATSKSDPYLAERFISLGKDRGIDPDARTYQLQMDYRLTINDVDGALIAYNSLQSMDVSSHDHLPAINRLIRALISGNRHDFDTVMNVAMDLSDRKARFEPETVTALALLHLNRDEVHDVIDLLNTHAHHYSSGNRASIRDAVLAFCLDPHTPISRAWDAYTVVRVIFDETQRPERTEIMKNFFARGRADMAVSVFHEMRKHSRIDTMPTVNTYATAFMGSAQLRDLDTLEVIHNQLKLDYNIDVNTYLLNALMIAYTACDQPRKAIGFWNDIVSSKEGPTFNSIHIALRACEKAPFGDLRAKELWEKLRKMHVDLDQNMWASYVAALAGNGDNELALRTVEEAEAQNELEVDAFLVGSLYDGAQNESKQAEIELWAKGKYPAVWDRLHEISSELNGENGRKRFKIDRSVTP